MEEATRAVERFTDGVLNQLAYGKARYRQGDIHRLRGELAEAEDAYTDASRHGHEPQPGLALLRLAQGNTDAAAGAIRRSVGESTGPLKRAGLLPAYVEIMLGSGELERARGACRELAEIARSHASEALEAMSAQAFGAVAVAEGDAQAALASLRRAARVWQEHNALYEGARVRVLVGLACRALGDEDGATLELDAARDAFSLLGAEPDVARVDVTQAKRDVQSMFMG